MWKQLFERFKIMLVTKVKEVIPTLEELLINEIKELLNKAEIYLHGNTFEEAKVKLMDIAFTKISLPWFAKPFKGIIKKEMKKTLDKTLDNMLRELKEKLNK